MRADSVCVTETNSDQAAARGHPCFPLHHHHYLSKWDDIERAKDTRNAHIGQFGMTLGDAK